MDEIAPPEQPGWYADAGGAWWWWDGVGWTPQVAPAQWGGGGPADRAAATRSQDKTMAMVMWIIYLVGGGFISPLVFYFVAKDKPYTRHHSAEGLNLTLVLLVPQVVAMVLLLPDYVALFSTTDSDEVTLGAGFFVGLALLGLTSLANYALAVTGIVKAVRGSWIPLPIGLHPVRGVVKKGAEPPYRVT